jgi:hypothetical protein
VTFNFARSAAGEVMPEEWTVDHAKLLYMLSKYALPGATGGGAPSDEERWIRQLPLYVLLYEGICEGAGAPGAARARGGCECVFATVTWCVLVLCMCMRVT